MASADRMEAIMSKAAEEGRTLDESESEEYKNVTSEVTTVDDHLVKLRALESAQAARAKALPANGIKSVDDGGRARDPATAYIRLEEQLPKGVEFARYVKCLAAAGAIDGKRWRWRRPTTRSTRELQTVLKAAVAAGTTTDATWAGPFVEYQTLTC